MCPAKPDINIKCRLAIARHDKIDNLEKPNGYNSCDAQLCLYCSCELCDLIPRWVLHVSKAIGYFNLGL